MEQKPLILKIEEAKQELIQATNDILQKHGLNCYLILPGVADLYALVKETAQEEITQAKTQMEQAKVSAPNNAQ